VESDVSSPTTWGDRLAVGGCFTAFLGLAGLTGRGAWTALRFVIDLL
jgi:predicted small integral membrane protein